MPYLVRNVNKVHSLKPWEVVEFSWGTAVRKRNGGWTHVFIGDQELDVTGMNVRLNGNGIEFL